LNRARILRVLAGTLVTACGVLADAQSTQNQSSSSLMANVLDRNGGAVRNLPKDNFRIRVDGHPAIVLDASYSLAPRRIIALLDMSGSMDDQDHRKWKVAREAMEDLLTETPRDVSIALLTFSDDVHDVFDFSQSRSSISAWLKEGDSRHGDARIHGRTALFDAVLRATKVLGPARPGDAIYLISDGGDNRSHTNENEIRELLLRSEIRLFVFFFAEYVPYEVLVSPNSLKEISRDTGGFIFGVEARSRGINGYPSGDLVYDFDERTRERIKACTRALNIQVNGFYKLRLDLPGAPGKARKVSLDVVDGTGKPRKDVTITHSTLLRQPK
jgi:hypothetical protein